MLTLQAREKKGQTDKLNLYYRKDRWPRLLISQPSPTQWVPRPSRRLRRAGGTDLRLQASQRKIYRSEKSHPCKVRKDGAPSVVAVHKNSKVGHPPMKAMFLAANRIAATDGDSLLAYQLFQIAKRLKSGQLMLRK